MKLRRFAVMGVVEAVTRARQEASKWLERCTPNGGTKGLPQSIFKNLEPNGSWPEIQSRVRGGDFSGAAIILLDHFREASRRRFFEGAVREETSSLLALHAPATVEETLDAAEAACRRRFDLLGYRDLFFGEPIDWHLDPISGRRPPLVHWSHLDPLDSSTVGDSKVIWELSRHQWLVRLGQAYRLAANERYAETFASCVQSWMDANPKGLGINWASSLEVSLRLISWCWALFLVRYSKALTPGVFAHMLSEIHAHASHVEKYPSYYFSPNTHLTGEALGLFYAGILFPELRAAKRWRTLGTQILVAESERQVLPDGVYFEQSTYYQRYTVEIYLHFLILAARNGVSVPPVVAERVQRMLDFLLAVRRPDGSMPQIGDCDGGWILPLADRAPDDYRGIFSTAAAVFGRPDYAWAAGELAPETLWLLGEPGIAAFKALRPAPPATAPSRLFIDGGYAVMRSGWDSESHQLIFDVGPLGCPMSGGHGHADLLSIQCSFFGEPCLIDPGTYSYTGESEWRDYFRGTPAHNTVMIDGIGQAVPDGPFKWQNRPAARLRHWVSNEAFDFTDASHGGYTRLPDQVIHRRRLLFLKPRYWVMVDDLQGASEHLVELLFQFGPIDLRIGQDLWARSIGTQGKGLLLRPFASTPLKGRIYKGEVNPILGWVSPNYGQRQPAPILIYSARVCFPFRIVSVLLPTAGPPTMAPVVSPLEGEGPDPVGLVFDGGREVVRFTEPEFTLEHN